MSPQRRWGLVLRYGFGGFLCLLAVAAVWVGGQWYWALITLCAAAIILLGQRRIFRPGVRRTTDEVICRYIPWYEGNAYLMCLLLPLTGACAIAASREPSTPAWIRVCGIGLLGIGSLLLWSVVHVWHRSVLRIRPSALAMRSGMLWTKPIEIRRDQVESVTAKTVPNPVAGQSLQVEIGYHPVDADTGQVAAVLLGMHLTVQPTNLLGALLAWNDGAAADDPTELLDRIERILRGRAAVGG